jgi:photosystem II stability/assembly factor-like uncharacterized protein
VRRIVSRLTNRIYLTFPFVLLTIASPLPAQSAVVAMRMLTPQVGWAEKYGDQTLWWTEDGGTHWRDITPKSREAQTPAQQSLGVPPPTLTSIDFLKTTTGWVLICCGDSATKSPEGFAFPEYEVAITKDAGATWSVATLKFPPGAHIPAGMDAYAGQIEFADASHGWLNLTGSAGHSAWGVLLTTSDGGTSWRLARSEPPGGAGAFSIVTANEGWQLTPSTFFEPSQTGLSVTRNGGRSWHDVEIPIPKELLGVTKGAPPWPYYSDLPRFDEYAKKHGFVTVTYRAQESGSLSDLVLFETNDEGRSWKPIRMIGGLAAEPDSISFDVVGSTLIAARVSQDNSVKLTSDGPEGKSEVDLSGPPSGRGRSLGVSEICFISSQQGWILAMNKLLSTSDGGKTWEQLQPEHHLDCGDCLLELPNRRGVDIVRLLSKDTGWALSQFQGTLLWTRDGGSTWKDITPLKTPSGPNQIVAAFFLDEKKGWAVGPDSVFSTEDAGAHWSMTDLLQVGLVDPPLKKPAGFGPTVAAEISFSDALHGWLNLAPEWGRTPLKRWLLATSDGGRTWRRALGEPGYAGSVLSVSADECWMQSYNGETLSVTRDGGQTWENIALLPPGGIERATTPFYDLPTFQGQNGSLSVTYPNGAVQQHSNGAVVLFATNDGGRTWKANRSITLMPSLMSTTHVSTAVVGNQWFLVNKVDHQDPTVIAVPAGAKTDLPSRYTPPYSAPIARQLSFVSPSRGWVLFSDNSFLSTSNGGASWSATMTPIMPPPVVDAGLLGRHVPDKVLPYYLHRRPGQ